MIHWYLFYGVPALLTLVAWTLFLLSLRRSVAPATPSWIALLGLIGATIPSFFGLWALTHVMVMASRVPTDYTYEHTCFLLGLLGAIAALVWGLRSKLWQAWITLASALWMALLWGIISFQGLAS